jgi:hypothetical protein
MPVGDAGRHHSGVTVEQSDVVQESSAGGQPGVSRPRRAPRLGGSPSHAPSDGERIKATRVPSWLSLRSFLSCSSVLGVLLRELGDTGYLTRIRRGGGEASSAQAVGRGIMPAEYPLDRAFLNRDDVSGELDC